MLALDFQDPEEVANTLTHGVGAIVSAAAGVMLVAQVATSDGYRLASAIVFSVALFALYTASTLFHWERDPLVKGRLELLDHCAIFVLIAGSYTPFLLVTLRDGVGLPMLALIWVLAIAGVLFKLICGTRYRIASTLLYIAMGWLVLVIAGPMREALPLSASLLLLAGGLSYTGGAYFFVNERIRYSHAIWHLFVLVGSVCHFAAVALQLLPQS